MVLRARSWALTLAACFLAVAPAPTKAQSDTAVLAELPEDVQLLFDIELRGPPGGATNLLPWTAAKEAVVIEVLCKGYLPSADPTNVTIEIINAFTFLAPAPAQDGTSNSTRRLMQAVAKGRQAEQQQQQQQQQKPVRAQKVPAAAQQNVTAEAPAPAEQANPAAGQRVAAPAPATAAQPERQRADAAPGPDAPQPRWQQGTGAVPASLELPEEAQEAAAAPVPAAVQPELRQGATAADAPVAAQPAQQEGNAPAPAPAAAQPAQREGKAGTQRQDQRKRQQQERHRQRQQQEDGVQDETEDAGEEEAPLQEMVTGTGVELQITLPSKLARAAAELDAVEGAVTVGRLAQDLTAAGLVVESATLVAAYLDEPQSTEGSTASAATALAYGGTPAAAPSASA